MARGRSWTWTVIISLLVGVAGASVFWLYSPYGHDRLAPQVAGDVKTQAAPGEVERRARGVSKNCLPRPWGPGFRW